MRVINKRIAYTAPLTMHACIRLGMPLAASIEKSKVVEEDKTTNTIFRQGAESFNDNDAFADLTWETN